MISFDRKGNPILESEVFLKYELAVGPVWYRFFEGLKEKKIWGTQCPECKRILVPARAFCPRCFVDMENWIEVPQKGIVEGWVLVNYEYFGQPVKPPFIMGSIRLHGTHCAFIHLIGGFKFNSIEEAKRFVKNGIEVEAVWKEERKGNIMDIAHFKPVNF